MKILLKSFLLFTLLILVLIPKKYFRSHEYMSIRQMGMGNAYTAIADDYFLMDVNPAGLARKTRFFQTKEKKGILQIPILNLSGGISGKLVEGINNLKNSIESSDGKDPISSLFYVGEQTDRLPFSGILRMPFDWGYIGYKYGFKADSYIESYSTAQLEYPLDVKTSQEVGSEFKFGIAPVTLSLLGKQNLHIGGTIKFLSFSIIEDLVTTGEAGGWFDTNKQVNHGKLRNWTDDINDVGLGLSLSVGCLWDVFENWSFGISVIDMLSVVSINRVPYAIKNNKFLEYDKTVMLVPNVKTGVAYRLPFSLKNFFKNTVFAIDYSRWFDPGYSFFTRLHIGASTDVFHTKLFGMNISMGLNQGYFTFSTMFKLLTVVRFGYVYFQEAGGIDSGSICIERHIFEAAIKF
jgi:hypothetical protein